MRLHWLSALLVTIPAFSAQIILNPSNVIGYYGQYDATLFPAGAIFSQQTGTINEPAQDGSYWLNSDNGPFNAYIVIDLGAAYQITSLELFNTHNAGYSDRGTGNFTFEAGNAVTPTGVAGAAGMDLAGPVVTILNGTLTGISAANDPIVGQTFAVNDIATYRYLKFEPNSVAVGGSPCCGANVYGLNELRAFSNPASATPEPGAVLLVACGLSVLVGRRLRASTR